MSRCFTFGNVFLTLTVLFFGFAGTVSNASTSEKDAEKVVVPISNAPQFTFKVPANSRVSFSLLTNKNTKGKNNRIGTIVISDQGCSVGHQVYISYGKSKKESQFVYFPKEVPWETNYQFGITQDLQAKTLTLTLNGESISVMPFRQPEFVYLINDPQKINLLNIAQNKI